jgi:predicted TPR repeat methyltransferase
MCVTAQGASAQERVQAETLFRSGKQKMEAGQYPEACADFAESVRLDPAGGTKAPRVEVNAGGARQTVAIALGGAGIALLAT